jgi:hypothetical protein
MKCASCDIELSEEPIVLDRESFCCEGCAYGGPCVCTYQRDHGRYPRNGHTDSELASELLD